MSDPRTVPDEYHLYRVRRAWWGKCVLQVLVDGPSLIGGQIDSSRRDLTWHDVDFKRAPVILTARRIKTKDPYP